MTNQERDQINRRFAELVGAEDHKMSEPSISNAWWCCTCGAMYALPSIAQEHVELNQPNFISHPTLVLKEMMVKNPKFVESLFSIDEAEYHSWKPQNRSYLFTKYINYILDETEGLLVKAASECLERESGA